MNIEPAILHGEVRHARLRPAVNRFAYPAFCLRLPLSSMPALAACGLAVDRWAPVAFHTRDHGARDGSPLASWVRAILSRHGLRADGEIVLHAFPRMLGYVFNPVSFYFCHGRAGEVQAVLAEVHNTFGERHNYLLAHADGRPIVSGETLCAHKRFHVSPFCEVRGNYEFRFRFEPDRWLARIEYFDAAPEGSPAGVAPTSGGSPGPTASTSARSPLLTSSVSGVAEAMTSRSMRRLLRRYPGFTAAVVARIHWQALRLWAKRVPFHRKPEPPLEETTTR